MTCDAKPPSPPAPASVLSHQHAASPQTAWPASWPRAPAARPRALRAAATGRGGHFTFLCTEGLIAGDPAEGSIKMSHTQSLCRALEREPVLAVKLGDRAFKENPSAGRPEAVLGDAWVSAHLKVIQPYIDREKRSCL